MPVVLRPRGVYSRGSPYGFLRVVRSQRVSSILRSKIRNYCRKIRARSRRDSSDPALQSLEKLQDRYHDRRPVPDETTQVNPAEHANLFNHSLQTVCFVSQTLTRSHTARPRVPAAFIARDFVWSLSESADSRRPSGSDHLSKEE